ncbi:hypothetical protein MIND_00429100 [Mycena indigotica]|uniref:Uncharacterized protein n=1 Tax=Mycena indigotica TaxID=2126181 RepID=A0A8H6SVY7_9AGAR|nr:uncharacterized protein MIND_00429100 [Mycena indigotica]KAF7306379.1 hypothetical protein MIND_00429100 [Mycena indigotica]
MSSSRPTTSHLGTVHWRKVLRASVARHHRLSRPNRTIMLKEYTYPRSSSLFYFYRALGLLRDLPTPSHFAVNTIPTVLFESPPSRLRTGSIDEFKLGSSNIGNTGDRSKCRRPAIQGSPISIQATTWATPQQVVTRLDTSVSRVGTSPNFKDLELEPIPSAAHRVQNYRASLIQIQDEYMSFKEQLAAQRAALMKDAADLRKTLQDQHQQVAQERSKRLKTSAAHAMIVKRRIEVLQRRLAKRRVIEELEACDITLQHLNSLIVEGAENDMTRTERRNSRGYRDTTLVRMLRFRPAGQHRDSESPDVRIAYSQARQRLTDDQWAFADALLKKKNALSEVRDVIQRPRLGLAAYKAGMTSMFPQFSQQYEAIIAEKGPRKRNRCLLAEEYSPDSVASLEEDMGLMNGLLKTLCA